MAATFMKTLVNKRPSHFSHRPSSLVPLATTRKYSSTPPPPTKSVCLVGGQSNGDDEFSAQIYKIYPKKESTDRYIYPIYEGTNESNIKNSITLSSGSTLFFLGGPGPYFQTFDVTHPEDGFQCRWDSTMLETRTAAVPGHAAVALHDGRIYVFGGLDFAKYFDRRRLPCWSEIYDPVSATWTPLYKERFGTPLYTCEPDNKKLYALVERHKPVIVVRGTEANKIFAHNFEEGFNVIFENGRSNKISIPHMGFRGMSETPIRVGDTLYWLSSSKFGISIEAFNLNSKLSYSGQIESGWENQNEGRFLTHVGGDDDNVFCFFTTGFIGEGTKIYCTTFSVSCEQLNYGNLNVCIQNKVSFTISRRKFELNNVFPILEG